MKAKKGKQMNMSKMDEALLKSLLELDEWERKQIAMFLIGSTLNLEPRETAAKTLKKLDKEAS